MAATPFCDIGDNRPYLAFFQAKQRGESARYVMPMQIEWVRFDREHYNPRALAAVRQGAREGTLLDVATDPIFIGLMLRNLRERLTVEESEQGLKLEFRPTSLFDDSMVREPSRVRGFESEFPASSALVDHIFAFKLFRKLEPGIHPAIEMGRFLTEVAGFANAPALLGTAELIEADGSRSAIATLHAQVQNQGDAWTVTSAYLDRFVEERRFLHDSDGEEQTPLRQMAQTGKRLAELHLALASNTTDPDFAPEAIQHRDWQRWTEEIVDSADRALDVLKLYRSSLREYDRPLIDQLAAQRAALPEILGRLLPPRDRELMAIRQHGNFALGKALIVADDIFITGFEGEAGRTLAQRRRKMPAARDVAGLIHSIDAAAAAALQRALKLAPDDQGKAGAAARRMARPVGRGLPQRLPRDHERRPAVAGRPLDAPSGRSISSSWRRLFTRSNTKRRIGRTGCASPSPPSFVCWRSNRPWMNDKTFRRSLRDRRRPPLRSLSLSRPAQGGRQDHRARLPARSDAGRCGRRARQCGQADPHP